MSKPIDKWTDPECGEVELQMFLEQEDDFVLICDDNNDKHMSDYDYLQVALRRLAQLVKERDYNSF